MHIFVLLYTLVLVFMAMLIISNQSPFVVSLIIILMSIFISLVMLINGLTWFGFALILIFLGGIIVVFSYASAIGGTQKIKNNVSILSAGLVLMLRLRVNYFFHIEETNRSFLIIKTIFSEYFLGVLFFFCFMLLITIFLIIKLIKFERGALKF